MQNWKSSPSASQGLGLLPVIPYLSFSGSNHVSPSTWVLLLLSNFYYPIYRSFFKYFICLSFDIHSFLLRIGSSPLLYHLSKQHFLNNSKLSFLLLVCTGSLLGTHHMKMTVIHILLLAYSDKKSNIRPGDVVLFWVSIYSPILFGSPLNK